MKEDRSFKRALVTGLIGGLVGSWAMNQYWTILGKMKEKQASDTERELLLKKQEQRQIANPTVKVAEVISENLFHHQLSIDEKKIAGPAVHYVFGALTGALYGLAAELASPISAGYGTRYATAVWFAADELALPLLGLSELPTAVPISQHLEGLGAHWIYGATLEAVRRPSRCIF